MSKVKTSVALLASVRSSDDLFSRTVRMVVVLVGACALFVGTLSAAAVAITSKAIGAPAAVSAPHVVDGDRLPATPPKKPLSI